MFLLNSLFAAGNQQDFTIASNGSRSYARSGVEVSEQTILSLAAAARAISLPAQSLACLPVHLYERSGQDRKVNTSHPVAEVLNQPNKKDSKFEYFESGQGFVGLNGNHIAIIERDAKLNIKELIPIHRDKVTILRGSDGLPYYRLHDGKNTTLSMENIHHVKAWSFDGYQGSSPIHYAADSLGLAMATEQHASKIFANGVAVSGVIERPKDAPALTTQTAVDNIVNSFQDRHSGLRSKISVALLQEGMTYKQLSQHNDQAQLIESRRLGIADVSRLWGVPLSMLNESAGESYKSIEQQSLNYVIYCLLPHIKRWESAMARDLFVGKERAKYFVEFDVKGLLQGDINTRYAAYAFGRQWGFLSVNDIRRLENLPPLAQGGDIYLTPLNMADTAQIKDPALHQQLTTATDQQLTEIEKILCRSI
jgi:HK97 family phage portal protein